MGWTTSLTVTLALTLTTWLPAPTFLWAEIDPACEKVHTVTVSPEEYVGDTSLTELMSRLTATGREMAVGQVTTTRVLGKSKETIRDDNIRFTSDTSQRFRGTVTSHEILERAHGKIGSRETLRITMRVTVCVTPADQVWYVRVEDITSEKLGAFDFMKARFASPTDRIQLVQAGDERATDATHKMHALAFSEKVSVRDYTNDDEIQAYRKCVREQRAGARAAGQVLGAFGLGNIGRALESAGGQTTSCGDEPRRFRGKRLEAEAIFKLDICDTHSGDCQSVRQRHESQKRVATKKDARDAVREFYDEGFGLVGALALHNLQRTLGMSDK